MYPTIEEASNNMVQVSRQYLPNETAHQLYDQLYHEVDCQFCEWVHDLINRASKIIKENGKSDGI